MRKYCVHPGKVLSKHDEDEHYISARKLMSLYNVPVDECVICFRCQRNIPYGAAGPECEVNRDSEYIHLFPSYHGKYNLNE